MARLPTIRELSECLCKLTGRVTDVEDTLVGNATLVGGTVSVADPLVTATSYVLLTRKTISTAGTLTYTLTPGTGITINSSSGTDVGVITYEIRH